MNMTRILILLFSLAILASCSQNQSENTEPGDIVAYDVTYTGTDEDFCNPERGYYQQYTLWFRDGSLPSPVSAAALETGRKMGRTLSLTLFYLTDFMEGDISEGALDVIRKSLQAHRDGGVKAILRFAYKDGYSEEDKPWDAPVDVVLRHVEQLGPVFEEYKDVIYVLQAGFVGAWGEWYYTSNFNMDPDTDEDWEPRMKLIRALLDAMPEDRQVALRTPGYKMKFLGMEEADTITVAEAYGTSDKARLAGHNDCFISSSNDVGTYGSSAERMLWKGDTEYAIMGGETCAAEEHYCNCDKAFVALEDYHWSYLNSGYHAGVFSVWRDGGCYDDIARRLGYRIVMKGACFDDRFAAGQNFHVEITLRNEGFASLMNPRPVEFVIVDKSDPGNRTVVETDIDPRTWKGGRTYVLAADIALPLSLEAGKDYLLCLNLPDASEVLRDSPEFSVRFANEGVWDETYGYNVLGTFTAE